MLQPATKTRFEIGINLKDVEASGKLEKIKATNAMCSFKVKLKDEDGNVIDNGSVDDQIENLNPHMQPCGGALRGSSHLMSEVGSKHTVTWKTMHPDP